MEEWTRTLGQSVGGFVIFGVLGMLLLGGVLLARRNLKLRRSDRTGAGRLGLAFFCLLMASSMLGIDHIADLGAEFSRLRMLTAKALVLVAVVWLWYVALEPYVRRRWPQVLISWSRVLAGRFRDPLIGRDILVGGVFGLGIAASLVMQPWILAWVKAPPPIPRFWSWHLLLGPRHQISEYLEFSLVFVALLILFLILGLRLLLKKQWLAVLAVMVLQAALSVTRASSEVPLTVTLVNISMETIWWGMILFVLLRFGLLALIFQWYFMGGASVLKMIGLSGWPAGASWLALVFVAAVAGYGCHTAMAGRPLFKDELLEA